MKLQIRTVDTDSLDEKNNYYLYEVIGDTVHYLVARSDEELNEEDQDTRDYSNKYEMYNREEFDDREWEIAKYLFMFLWDSDNGTNTEVERDIYEDDGFTQEELEQFISKFQFDNAGVLDMYEDGGVEIYWDYFSMFNLMSCNPWEDQ